MAKFFGESRRDKILAIVIIGSFCHFFLSLLFATVVFNQTITNSSSTDPKLQMIMRMDPMERRVEIWMDAIFPLHATVEIGEIYKRDADCKNPSPGSLTDLIPITGPVCGSGSMVMRIAVANEDDMPSFKDRSDEVMPMAYVKEESMAKVRPMLKFVAVMLRKFTLICWTIVLLGISLFLTGGLRLYFQWMKP